MCNKDRTLEENVDGAETLAYLLETDAMLQSIAAVSDHIIKTLAEYLKYTDVQQISRSGRRTVCKIRPFPGKMCICCGSTKGKLLEVYWID